MILLLLYNRVFSEIIAESLQFFMYLEDWYKHRGAAQAKLQVGVQGINQNTI